MSDTDLTTKTCVPCEGGVPPMTESQISVMMPALDEGWQVAGSKLVRTFKVKGFAPAVFLANAAAFLAEREGHHPDVSFGWGWCTVTFWTHAIGGLSENDFICAAKLDQMVAGAV